MAESFKSIVYSNNYVKSSHFIVSKEYFLESPDITMIDIKNDTIRVDAFLTGKRYPVCRSPILAVHHVLEPNR